MRYVHVAEAHRRQIPAEVLAAAAGRAIPIVASLPCSVPVATEVEEELSVA